MMKDQDQIKVSLMKIQRFSRKIQATKENSKFVNKEVKKFHLKVFLSYNIMQSLVLKVGLVD